MKEISEMIRFVHEYEHYQGKTFSSKQRENDNSDVFYEKVLAREFENEEQAAVELFGKKDHRYKRLKRKVTDKLINSVLLIESSRLELSTSSKKYYALIREIAVAKILMVKTLKGASLHFARKCYKKAEALGYYDIMYDAVWILKYYYGVMLKKESEYNKYNRKLLEIMEVLQLENKAYSYYSESLIMQKKDRADISLCYEFTLEKFNELSSYLRHCDSFQLQLVTRLLRTIYNSLYSDFESMLKDSNEDINYFFNRYKGHSRAAYIFLAQKTTACIRLGRYNEGLEATSLALDIIDEKSINWFPMKYNEFFIYMQAQRYEEAQRIYLKATNHRRYKTLESHMEENWVVGGAYLNYIIERNLLEPHNKFKFRIGKFVNSAPEYSKDRRVKNIPILIAQIIFMIYRKQTGKVIDRMDAIKQYCGRNLRYNGAVRSNSFIMALMEIPKCSFNRKAVDRRIGRFTKRLQEVPLHQSGKNFDLEIIPYERLLGYVLEDL